MRRGGVEIRFLSSSNQTSRQTDRQTDIHTGRQTEGHGHSMTESAQWGRFSENLFNISDPTGRFLHRVHFVNYCALHQTVITFFLPLSALAANQAETIKKIINSLVA